MTISPAGAGRNRNVTLTSTSGRFTTSAGPAPSETTVQMSWRRCPELRVLLRLEGERSTGIRMSRAEQGRDWYHLCETLFLRLFCSLRLRRATPNSPGRRRFRPLRPRPQQRPRSRKRRSQPQSAADSPLPSWCSYPPNSCTRTCACRHQCASSPSNCHTAASRPDAGHGGTDMAGADCRGGVPVLSV